MRPSIHKKNRFRVILFVIDFHRTAGNPSLLVGASVLTGVLGSNLNRWLLSLARFNDPVARALAVSSSSHGLGSAALAAKDEDLLPFAQVAYTLTALFALGACSTPFVAGQLGRLAGG